MNNVGPPRLLRASRGTPLSLYEHDAEFSTPSASTSLLDALETAGLTGRGGAGFPTSTKARLLQRQRGHRKAVVVNAMEGEPASRKDATLLAANPHLVLDGACELAEAIGGNEVVVCVPTTHRASAQYVSRAIEERAAARRDHVSISLQHPPARYIAGEESALTHWLNERAGEPTYRPHRPTVLTLRSQPVLIQNAETCAHVGLIARYGAEWFRSLGTHASPGSTLVTLSGAVERPLVIEAALGTPLSRLLEASGAQSRLRAVLLGGYGGAWIASTALDVPYASEELRPLGASVGAGVIVALGEDGCGVAETARIAAWMANEGAHQCGPCAFGLPALARDLHALAAGSHAMRDAPERLEERCRMIEGRGACHHPDGVARLVRSMLSVFGEDVAAHASGRPCAASISPRRYARIPGEMRVESRT
ncbi:MAG TPA: NADH-ubiquinone oxidoreductase-F iron-sulfur binding region domain-containing protein [Acidimicrobiales bacterium]|jgi:NADH:ubiquinone oxidoreductase subunit F (NADH-binding)